MKDKISVIVPCYNVDKYVGRCLKCIENQTYGFENIELILIDDLSSDDTPAILEAFRSIHSDNTIVINNKTNRGVSYNRNIGMDLATGKYIAFVDSDDVITLDALEKMYQKAEEYNADVVRGRHEFFSGGETISSPEGEHSGFVDMSNDDARKNMIIMTFDCYVWAKLFRREALMEKNIRFHEGDYYEDVSFTLQWLLLLDRFCYIDSTVYFYLTNRDGIVNSQFNADRVRYFVKTLEWVLDELKKRSDYEELWNKFQYEIESFCLWLGFIEPMKHIHKEIAWYREHMLNMFPNINNSPYVSNITDPAICECIRHLKDN